MRALSIRQPWAWLILHAGKTIENRTWTTRYRGRILIHAGQQINRDAYAWIAEHFPHVRLPAPSELQRGGFVGSVDIIDCFAKDDAHAAKASGWYMGESGLVLRDPRPGHFVAAPGKLSLYTVDDAVSRAVHPEDSEGQAA